ncbi:MAG: hypothetical protein CVU11_10595 [Bacteroidetes bacterium HGW-Bacteroidetes-6]|jgi:hypothetical protein|nr:MAG: hypothetical protein CVU11_10595 [Bacteroidetes bacterium HGW-Bacteroidetes-6]
MKIKVFTVLIVLSAILLLFLLWVLHPNVSQTGDARYSNGSNSNLKVKMTDETNLSNLIELPCEYIKNTSHSVRAEHIF